MQKARRHVITTLRPLVGRRVQGLFHSPARGSFHLSLTGTGSLSVSREYLALRDGPRSFTQDFSCPALLRMPLGFNRQSCTGLSPSTVAFSKAFHLTLSCHVVVLQPPCRLDATGLGSSCSLATTYGIIVYFLLLWVLRCFSSPRSPPLRDDRPSACRVAPFGYPGINGYLRLPRAFRSLSRPSSPPRAKASTVCPCLLSLTSYIRTG